MQGWRGVEGWNEKAEHRGGSGQWNNGMTLTVDTCHYTFVKTHRMCWGFPGGSDGKEPPAMCETRVQSLGQEDPLEKGMDTHSSILGWRIPWAEGPGGLQSLGSQRGRHDWVTLSLFTFEGCTAPRVNLNVSGPGWWWRVSVGSLIIICGAGCR